MLSKLVYDSFRLLDGVHHNCYFQWDQYNCVNYYSLNQNEFDTVKGLFDLIEKNKNLLANPLWCNTLKNDFIDRIRVSNNNYEGIKPNTLKRLKNLIKKLG